METKKFIYVPYICLVCLMVLVVYMLSIQSNQDKKRLKLLKFIEQEIQKVNGDREELRQTSKALKKAQFEFNVQKRNIFLIVKSMNTRKYVYNLQKKKRRKSNKNRRLRRRR